MGVVWVTGGTWRVPALAMLVACLIVSSHGQIEPPQSPPATNTSTTQPLTSPGNATANASLSTSSSTAFASSTADDPSNISTTTTAGTAAPTTTKRPPPPHPLPPFDAFKRFNQSTTFWFLPPAIPGLLLNFVGYRYIGVTLFTVGGAISAAVFFTFSPQIFPNTPFCCGDEGTLTGRIIVSLIIGMIGGGFALWAFRFGLFLIGLSLGLLVALGLHLTPIRDAHWLSSQAEVIAYYTVLMVLGGVASLFFRKLFVILATSIGGSLLFMLGVEFFAETGFGALVLYSLSQIVDAIRGDLAHGDARVSFSRSFSTGAYLMVSSWLVLTVIGMAVQFATGTRGGSKTQEKVFVINRSEDGQGAGRYVVLRVNSGRSPSDV